MQGELAQLISLTSYGNDYLKTGNMPLFYYPDHNTFKFCRVVEFIISGDEETSAHYQKVWAENPLMWFEKLKQQGCTHLWLSYQPADRHPLAEEHQLVGFVGGGGRWLIEAEINGRAEYWLKSWEVTHRDDPERKIWTVKYFRIEENAPLSNPMYNTEEVKKEFGNVLAELIRFCQNQNLPQWGNIFENGNKILTETNPFQEKPHLDLLVNKNYSITSQQLLNAIDETWVFGGMGSWNDIGFEEAGVQKEYDTLSELLYAVMMKGIVAAVNSF